ncbi:MAG: right-handed parallel beta-helix repeat-containing protein [Armatimonadetes bacterium]|nr:right-handed parallel beta-helix repeat-containing protein [Armatimonadota bacterium]
MRVCLFFSVFLYALQPLSGEVNKRAIEDVATGKTKVARASWWGFDPEDVTLSLQAAIDSGARKLIIENMGRPWIVTGLRLASHQEIVFEKGVEVLAKKGAFQGTGDSLFLIDMKENITLRGYGATLRMRRSDYAGPSYRKAEWRHVLDFRSCKNVRVYGLTLAESGGDGIYLGAGQEGTTNRNIYIKDVVCDRNYRQGISVITAENLLIERCVLRDTAGTAPAAGIDFEPNQPRERLVNCVMKNCVTQGNAGGGYLLYLGFGPQTIPVSIRFENCASIEDTYFGTFIHTPNSPEKAVKGSIRFNGCAFERTKGAPLMIQSNPATGCRLRFDGGSILDPRPHDAAQPPILLMASREDTRPVGNIAFNGLRLRDPRSVRPIRFIDMAGESGVRNLSGRLLLERRGSLREIALNEKVLKGWMLSAPLKPIPRMKVSGLSLRPCQSSPAPTGNALEFARLRDFGSLVLYAAQGDRVSFTIRHMQVAQYSGSAIPVAVTAPSGKGVLRTEAPFQGETPVGFTAPETGVYRISANARLNYLQILNASHPVNLNGEGGPVHLYASAGDFFFRVPAGTREFGVRISGEGIGEAVRAALIDPTGTAVQEADNIVVVHQFEVKLSRPSSGEIWSLRLAPPTRIMMEDQSIDLRGIPPLLAASRETVLREE